MPDVEGYKRVFGNRRFHLPTCAVCRRPVQHIEGRADHTAGVYVMVATCHGETERVEIPLSHFEDPAVTHETVDFGTAFAAKACGTCGVRLDAVFVPVRPGPIFRCPECGRPTYKGALAGDAIPTLPGD